MGTSVAQIDATYVRLVPEREYLLRLVDHYDQDAAAAARQLAL